MNVVIYIASIVGSIVVMAGVYYLVKKYAAAFLLLCSIGSGFVAAKIIIAKDLSILVSVGVVVACGLIAGVFSIPALLMTEIEDLEEKISVDDEKADI